MQENTRSTTAQTSDLRRFLACMEYESSDRRPDHELGVWGQTRKRWEQESGGSVENFTWDWFVGEQELDLDRREYIDVNYGFIPPIEYEVLEETAEYVFARIPSGAITKALKEGTTYGTRMCMDQYLEFPVKTPEDLGRLAKDGENEMSTYTELLDHIQSLKIIDTHEHLPFEADRPKETDVLEEWLAHYFSSDLVSAGLSDEGLATVRDSSKDINDRWKLAEPFWRAAENTGYGRSLSIAAKGP